MNRLFAELYLDEDVNVLIADLIRHRGFMDATTLESGQVGATDAEQLAFAVNQQKTLVTHNRVDFEKLATHYAETEQTHYGIIIAVRRSPQEIQERLLAILNHYTADELENQLRYI